MMRTLMTLAAVALVALAIAGKEEAEAGLPSYIICWTMPSGESDCALLPRGYRIYGVRKPYCESPTCHRGQVSFVLTRSRISSLGRWIDTTSMFPTHVATIYAPK